MEQFLRIGVITQPHVLKGDVKVYPTTDSPKRFKQVKNVIIRTPEKEIETKITQAGFFKNLAIVKFAAFNSPEEARKFSGAEVYIRREDAVPLRKGEYYIADLIGCSVVTDDGKRLGVLKDVLQTGANDVYVVDARDADEDIRAKAGSGCEILLPVIKECIVDVDIEKCVVTAHIMPGLL